MSEPRYALYNTKEAADSFAAEIQALCEARNVKGLRDSRIIKYAVWIEWLGRYAVKMEVEPNVLPAVIVDSIEPPPTEGEE